MGKKVAGIFCFVAAAACLLLGVKAVKAAPGNQAIVENAILVSDGQVLLENEGKVVIVQGKLEAPLPFVDQQTGVSLNTIAALRNVDKLRIEEDEKKEAEVFDWLNTLEDRYFGGSQRLYAPNTTLGGFILEEKLLDSLSIIEIKDDYTEADKQTHGFGVFTDQNIRYLYQGERMPDQDEVVTHFDEPHRHKAYLDYVDTVRISYKQMDMTDLTYTIIGLQDNGTLRRAAELDMQAVHAGTLDREDLLAFAESSSKFALAGSIGFAVVLAAIGVLMIVRSAKQAETAAKGKKRA